MYYQHYIIFQHYHYTCIINIIEYFIIICKAAVGLKSDLKTTLNIEDSMNFNIPIKILGNSQEIKGEGVHNIGSV